MTLDKWGTERPSLYDPEPDEPEAREPSSGSPLRFLLLLIPIAYVASFFIGGWEHGRVQSGAFWRGRTVLPLGSKYFFAREGQRLRTRYEATVRSGAFRIWVFRMKPGLGGKLPGEVELLTDSTGERDFPVETTGIHWISIDGSPRGRGYDVSYDVRWWLE